MRLIFEDHKYAMKDVENVLSFLLSPKDRKRDCYTPKCVGYFYNPNIDNGEGKKKGDVVFILPKVLLIPGDDEKGIKETLFNVEPEKLINVDWEIWNKEPELKEGKLSHKEIFDFVYGFSIWIYRAIEVYRKNLKKRPKKQDDEEEVDAQIDTNKAVRMGKSGSKTDVTYMDIMLSLMDFNKFHHDYLMFVMKVAHSGYNKINWTKTITRSTAFFQEGVPLYLNPINKKRQVNFDEELLVIFYSILNYMHETYGFPMPNNPGYQLITGKMFESYMDKQGKSRLLRIKYKYFSDIDLKLWNLCYAFFDKTYQIGIQSNTSDYLLVNSFHTIFEAMIDELIGDRDLPENLKVQEGGSRRIDSLYTYKYLIENLNAEKEIDMTQKIYHIGDAKYHKRTNDVTDADVPKQFDYATNVIKWHMDLINELSDIKKAEEYKKIQLFDPITEGFNIIPNFFVSAKVEDLKSDYEDPSINHTEIKGAKGEHKQAIFGDRLFDRNTLFALHYDVKFLYVLKQYARNSNTSKAVWREDARKKFRDNTLEYLNRNFRFFQIMIGGDDSIRQFVSQFYYVLHGKVFSFNIKNEENRQQRVLVYAERKNKDNSPTDKSSSKGIFLSGIPAASKPGAKGKMTVTDQLGNSSTVDITEINLGESGYSFTLSDYNQILFNQKLSAAIDFLQQNKDNLSDFNLEALKTIFAEQDDEMSDLDELRLPYEDEVPEAEMYKKYIPLYSIKAACGKFLYNEEAKVIGWFDCEAYHLKPGDNVFVIQAKGSSMMPRIKDGQYCVFEHGTSFYEDDIILAEIPNKDYDYGGSYTIKKYHREKGIVDGAVQKTSITLFPINKDHEPMTYAFDELSDLKMVAVFKGVIE